MDNRIPMAPQVVPVPERRYLIQNKTRVMICVYD